MDQYKELAIGQVVQSIKGRDKNTTLIVIDFLDNSNVLVVDGNKRKLNKPKKKKIKHLNKTNMVLKLSNDINDSKIRKMLRSLKDIQK